MKDSKRFFNKDSPKYIELCPLIPPKLIGRLKIDCNTSLMEEIGALFSKHQTEVWSKLENCIARHKVAIIIPFRVREEHLKISQQNIHPIL